MQYGEVGDMPEVRSYQDSQLGEVAGILARAYLENPLHLAIFGGSGPEQLRQQQALFSISLKYLNVGTRVVLVNEGRVAGFAHWVSYPACRPSPQAMESAAPRLLEELGNEVLEKVITWRRAWGEHDPESPHSHFGPFAVDPDAQGSGFGRQLLARYCQHLDEAGEVAYLEAERPQNIEIYRRAGFEVTAQCDVLGLPNWFMTRAARTLAA